MSDEERVREEADGVAEIRAALARIEDSLDERRPPQFLQRTAEDAQRHAQPGTTNTVVMREKPPESDPLRSGNTTSEWRLAVADRVLQGLMLAVVAVLQAIGQPLSLEMIGLLAAIVLGQSVGAGLFANSRGNVKSAAALTKGEQI